LFHLLLSSPDPFHHGNRSFEIDGWATVHTELDWNVLVDPDNEGAAKGLRGGIK